MLKQVQHDDMKGTTMITAIRPYTPQNRQRQNFGKLDIPAITKNNHTAELFRTHSSNYPATSEHITQVEQAIINAKNQSKLGIASFLEDALEEFKTRQSKQ